MKYIVAIMTLCFCTSALAESKAEHMRYEEFIETVRSGNVISANLDQFSSISGTYRVNGETNQFNTYAKTGSANDPLLTELLSENAVVVSVDTENKRSNQLQMISGLMFLLFPLIIIGLQIKILNRTKAIENKIHWDRTPHH